MGLMNPKLPDFDVQDWSQRSYFERLQMMSVVWATQGFGAPWGAYLFYVFKLFFYVGGWLVFMVAFSDVGGLGKIAFWWASPVAFQKAVLWTMLYEVIGLGCGSGPLTGRYNPPVTAVAHWVRPGTIRLAPFPWVPGTRGSRRSLLDVGLFVAGCGLVVVALCSNSVEPSLALGIVATFCVLGLRDKTVFLSLRAEHYLLATLVFVFPADLFPAEKAIQIGLWLGAGLSKLTFHFPTVLSVMLSNSPATSFGGVRKRFYRSYPNDLRPARLPMAIAHLSTAIELCCPVLLLVFGSGPLGRVALVALVIFHFMIFSSFPMGVPLEWNVFFMYSAVSLFGVHRDIAITDLSSVLLIVVLMVCLVGMPLLGNARPDKVSFLPSMRYYAGNWAVSSWLFEPGLFEKIEDAFPTAARTPRRQIEALYDDGFFAMVMGRSQVFRAMHLHGRAVNSLLIQAVPADRQLDDYEVTDGELVAGVLLGWNFGDGHLHNESLLEAISDRVTFAPGELRCLFLESQALFTGKMRWRVVDPALGVVKRGEITVDAIRHLQPWEKTDEIAKVEEVVA